jgi:kumamolisin
MDGIRVRRHVLPAAGAIVLVLLLSVVALPASAASTHPISGATLPTLLPSVAPDPLSFAARADYDPGEFALVTETSVARGPLLVDVTFQSRSPSLYDSPAPGSVPLTLPEIADRFGLTPDAYAAVTQYFASQGLTIVHTWPDRLALTLEGTPAEIDRAFDTSIRSGIYDGRTVSFPVTPPALPSSIEPMVESVVGLTTGFDGFSFPAMSPVSAGADPAQGNLDLVTPAIARQIYGLSSLYNRTGSPQFASSQSIALLLWGMGYVPSDLQSFYQQSYPASFPSVTVADEPVDGAPSPSSSAANDPCGASQELTLDLEWSGSMAPGAKLYAVYAPESPAPTCSPTAVAMSDALHMAIGLPVDAISMSFGTPESSDASLRATWDTYLAEAVQEGITPLAATGDLGGDAQSGCRGGPAPQYPASSPNVLAVGGTDVSLSRNLLGQVTGFSETAWNDSGGGVSTQSAAPGFQQGLGLSGRGMPDVSATAADNYLYFNAQAQTAGGTSFATPLWAGLVTEMVAQYGHTLAPLAPRLYAIGGKEPSGKVGIGLADITSGNTCIASAGPGWDEATGWGSPRALLLYEDLTATFVDLALHVSSATIGPGGTLTITAHLANQSTGAAIAGVPVEVNLASGTNLGPCTGTFTSSEPATDGSGNVSVTGSVPWCYLGSSATVTVQVLSDGYYGTNSTNVAVNLLGLVPALGGLAVYPTNILGFVAIFAIASAIGYLLGRRPSRTTQAPSYSYPSSPPDDSSPPPSIPVPGPPVERSPPVADEKPPEPSSEPPPAEDPSGPGSPSES